MHYIKNAQRLYSEGQKALKYDVVKVWNECRFKYAINIVATFLKIVLSTTYTDKAV